MDLAKEEQITTAIKCLAKKPIFFSGKKLEIDYLSTNYKS